MVGSSYPPLDGYFKANVPPLLAGCVQKKGTRLMAAFVEAGPRCRVGSRSARAHAPDPCRRARLSARTTVGGCMDRRRREAIEASSVPRAAYGGAEDPRARGVVVVPPSCGAMNTAARRGSAWSSSLPRAGIIKRQQHAASQGQQQIKIITTC